MVYTKSHEYTWNKQFKDVSAGYRATFKKNDAVGYYVTQPLHSGKPAKVVPEWRGVKPPGGRGWAYKLEKLDEFDAEGRIEWSSDGVPRLKRYLHEVEGAAIQDVWDEILNACEPEVLQGLIDYFDGGSEDGGYDIWADIKRVLDRALAHTGYPTQKPQKLVERMIRACTNRGI